ncbi:MAG: hypothetical protein GY822_31755 [Deltaproteobacteria bacterium]|nr:hypothetical protein [Deltaproteobacteria bacterium]
MSVYLQEEKPVPDRDFWMRLTTAFGLIVLLVMIDMVSSFGEGVSLLHILFSGGILLVASVGLWTVLRKLLQSLNLFQDEPAIEKARQKGKQLHEEDSDSETSTALQSQSES